MCRTDTVAVVCCALNTAVQQVDGTACALAHRGELCVLAHTGTQSGRGLLKQVPSVMATEDELHYLQKFWICTSIARVERQLRGYCSDLPRTRNLKSRIQCFINIMVPSPLTLCHYLHCHPLWWGPCYLPSRLLQWTPKCFPCPEALLSIPPFCMLCWSTVCPWICAWICAACLMFMKQIPSTLVSNTMERFHDLAQDRP